MRNLRDKANSMPGPLSHKGRREAETKLRTDGRSCPLCLRPLPSLSGKGKIANACAACAAKRQAGKRCAKCGADAIWESDTIAACQACGAHGSKLRVVADALER